MEFKREWKPSDFRGSESNIFDHSFMYNSHVSLALIMVLILFCSICRLQTKEHVGMEMREDD